MADSAWSMVKVISDFRLPISGLYACFFALTSLLHARRSLLLALTALLLAPFFLLLALCSSVQAQQAKRVFKLGYLTNDSVSVDMPRRNVFRQALHDLGYLEGQNLVIEYRIAEGRI